MDWSGLLMGLAMLLLLFAILASRLPASSGAYPMAGLLLLLEWKLDRNLRSKHG